MAGTTRNNTKSTGIRRSRTGCHNCKRLKIKCDEAKPKCSYCVKTESTCDYSIKLTWGGRPYKDANKRQNGHFDTYRESPQLSDFITKSESQTPLDIESPPSFNTPGGISILSPQQVFIQTGLGSSMGTSHPDSQFGHPNGIEHQSESHPPPQKKDSLSSLLLNMPDLSTGIESLSNALEKVVDGGGQFGLHNSEIFNRFLSSNIDDITGSNFMIPPEPHEDVVKAVDAPSSDDEFLMNYANDLAKVEAYFPKQKHNLLYSSSSGNILSAFSRNSSPKVQELEDDDSISIPPSLVSLPELLNQVPYYKQLMHFWVNVAAENLSAAPSHIYKDNPFKVLLPQMAMEYPAILTSILAFAATSMASIAGNKPPTEIVDQLVARSCAMLLKMLKDKDEATSDGTLATVLLLSCYESLVGDNFEKHRAHALGARQIIMARRLPIAPKPVEESPTDSPDSASSKDSTFVNSESDIAFFLMRWFVYIDVIGALSATRGAQYYLNQPDGDHAITDSLNSVYPQNPDTETIDPKKDIDYMLGFDVKFLTHFTDIVMLIRKMNTYLEGSDQQKNNIPIDIVTRALEVKQEFSVTYANGEARRQYIIDRMSDYTHREGASEGEMSRKSKRMKNLIRQDKILRSTNKLFFNMGLLNLYRRVLRIPRESKIIQQLTHDMGQELVSTIASSSSAEVCSIFCLFCAGCDTLDDDMRQLFKTRFITLSEKGNVHATKSLQIMSRCWSTGEDWIEASKSLDIDLTLL
ncbi:hypothetical protein CANTEDRAFT_126673 [Yamadazyma tenuis ATCC 10573]|uniref:Zn(2)-C6 fungal-type domain-containing protein n=1 Tax=Candida tenuis (strain ATCC 10573 / BCRC 21748 / CBS 615 / JCM 9827 / NBRC 10315 / NRRL Y-1498 / VKM Y-70) TaxID=590646 RepID=G3BEY9_CANTC|nr:uncharacterized protein CANTEDRAFT_126673 [Yamadazyma tenuis ATCC 10573]EGV59968.1 hypothetical protein CANTEDRAFT_126673 [Yamadazyma tenuis ATCC 10573]